MAYFSLLKCWRGLSFLFQLLAKILYEAADEGFKVDRSCVLDILNLSKADVAHVTTGTAPAPQAPSTAAAAVQQAPSTTAAAHQAPSTRGQSIESYLFLGNKI